MKIEYHVYYKNIHYFGICAIAMGLPYLHVLYFLFGFLTLHFPPIILAFPFLSWRLQLQQPWSLQLFLPSPSISRNQATSSVQVGSLSSSKVSRQLSTNDLFHFSSVSLLMTASTALANKGLFELTRRPLLTQAVEAVMNKETDEK